MSSPKFPFPTIVIVVVAIAAGWYFGRNQPIQNNASDKPENSAPQAAAHSHDDSHDHDHGHDHGDAHSHSPSPGPENTTEEKTEKPATVASRLQEAIHQSDLIRKQNETILNELLTEEDIRELYQKFSNSSDLSLYDDDGTRLSEEAFIKKWHANHGSKTPQMIAEMEAEAQKPIDHFLSQLNRQPGTGPSEEEQTIESPEEKKLAQERSKEIRRKGIDTIRNELLTRDEIESLYQLKLDEKSREVMAQDGSLIPKEEFVRQFINAYGELTPELEAALEEAASR